MKRFCLLGGVIIAMLSSCGEETRYKVECDVSRENVKEGDTLYLERYDEGGVELYKTDTAVVEGGKVCFEGDIIGSEVRRIEVGGKMVNFIVERGNVVVDLVEGLARGTELNEAMAEYVIRSVDITDKYARKWDELMSQGGLSRDEKDEQLSQMMKDAHREEYEYAKSVVVEHKSDALGRWAFMNGIADNECVSYDMFKQELAEAGEYISTYGPIVRVAERNEAQRVTCVGEPFADVELRSYGAETATVRLVDLVKQNRLTLMYIWASWSSPSVNSNEVVMRVYERYNAEGFDVVSVVIDRGETGDEWSGYFDELGYETYVDDDMSVLKTYGIDTVPYLILIGEDKKILARGISPSALLHWVRTELADEE